MIKLTDRSITMASYTSNQILAETMVSVKENDGNLAHYINILFKYTKFIYLNKDMDYGGIIYNIFIGYMEITTGAEAWWSSVETGISRWCGNARAEINKEYMSK